LARSLLERVPEAKEDHGVTLLEPSLDLATLTMRYRNGTLTVAGLVEEIDRRIDAAGDHHVWISRVLHEVLAARAAALDALDADTRAGLPLFGIPFAIKDNIDASGLATTAACPAFAYRPGEDAPAVARLQAAGALLIGKTNLDQFATGLVGVRSPYGVARNPFDARYIPGGSSAGSAVAVAAGLASFALGTDTAGSGRVPAAFNNIVGLKPTKGLISLRGVVPACASLDCVSIFALMVDDAETVLSIAGGCDADDPFSRAGGQAAAIGPAFRFGVPHAPEFFGDALNPALYQRAIATFEAIGGTAIEFDYAPFLEIAKLLYEGPWVAERMAAVERIYRDRPEAMLPVTRAIIGNADKFTAVDVFRGQYRLQELRHATLPLWGKIDAMVLPTAPTIYTVEEVNAEPIALNSRLGHYTNFVNLLDLVALAVPAGFRSDGLPFGVTLIAPAWHDRALASLGGRFARQLDLPLGATGHHLPPRLHREAGGDGMMIAVVGAHLSGMPLNHQLTEGGASLIAATRTAPHYRLYEIAGAPPRPGLVRAGNSAGCAIDAELWSVTPTLLGALLAATEGPLSIGNVELADGRWVKGFLCEASATAGARDISEFGGWRRFLAAQH
jgi:allophanate hydrolase